MNKRPSCLACPTAILSAAILIAAHGLAAPSPAHAEPVSTIMAPVFVPMDLLGEALEGAVPLRASGSRPAEIGGPVRNDTISWDFTRGRISLSGANDWLDASSRVRGHARVKGRVEGIRGSVGRFLRRLNPTLIPFSAHADLVADLRLRVKPQLTPDWRLDAEIAASAHIHEASIPVLRITRISVRSKLQREIDGKLQELADGLRQRLAADPFLERAAATAWDALCQAHPVATAADGGHADLWVVATPVAFHAAQPSIDARGMTLTLGVEAETRLVSRALAPVCGPLPPLRLGRAGPGLSLIVPAALDYPSLTEALSRQFVGQDIALADAATVTLQSVRLSGEEDAIGVSLGFDIRPQGWRSWFFDPTRASVQLTTTPQLDPAHQSIRFRNSRIIASSDDFTNLAGNMVALAQAEIVHRFEQAAQIDIAPQLAEARARAEQAAVTLGADGLGGLAVEMMRIDTLRVESVSAGAATLDLIMVATGELRLTLRTIPLGG